MSETSALEVLREAVEAFVAAREDEPQIVTQALVIWEMTRFDDDGQQVRCVSYSNPTDNFSLTGALGLIEAARYQLRRDILGAGVENDE